MLEIQKKERIDKIREKEIDLIRKNMFPRIFGSMSFQLAPILASLVSFLTYVWIDENNELTYPKIFSCLFLYRIIRGPMIMLPHAVNTFIRSYVSYRRVEKFLALPELKSHESFDMGPNGSEVIVEKASFNWGKEDFEMKNINLEIKGGQLVGIVGSVGAGKSSLVNAILGNMETTKGKVRYSGQFAYVPQEAWICNATVRDNITFGYKYDKYKYNKILQLAGLSEDIKSLQHGSQTMIGEKGINLSGGQKQRISIARSIYSKYDTLNSTSFIFDDPLSALDAHVAKGVFDNIMGPSGLLNKSTRIMVTNSLSVLPKCDIIYVVDKAEIVESGSYSQLIAGESSFSKILREFTKNPKEEEVNISTPKSTEVTSQLVLDDIDIHDPSDFSETSSLRTLSHQSSGCRSGIRSRTVSHCSNTAGTTDGWMDVKNLIRSGMVKRLKSQMIKEQDDESSDGEDEHDQAKPEDEDDLERLNEGRIKPKVFLRYFKTIGFVNICLFFLFLFCCQASRASADIWLSKLKDNVNTTNSTLKEIQQQSIQSLGVYGAFGIVQVLLWAAQYSIWMFSSIKASKQYHFDLLQKIFHSAKGSIKSNLAH